MRSYGAIRYSVILFDVCNAHLLEARIFGGLLYCGRIIAGEVPDDLALERVVRPHNVAAARALGNTESAVVAWTYCPCCGFKSAR